MLPTLKVGVIPVDNPTVPKAENVSNKVFSVVAASFPFSNEARQMWPTIRTIIAKNTNALTGDINTITINDGKVTSTNESAINVRAYTTKGSNTQYNDCPNILTINDGEFKGKTYALVTSNGNYVYVHGGSYEHTSTSVSEHPIEISTAYELVLENVTINTNNTDGITLSSCNIEKDAIINNVTINLAKNTLYKHKLYIKFVYLSTYLLPIHYINERYAHSTF